jgi:hypothetical protein
MRTALLAVLTAGGLAAGAAEAFANVGPPPSRPTTKSTTKAGAAVGRSAPEAMWVVPGMMAAAGVALFGAWLVRRGSARQS